MSAKITLYTNPMSRGRIARWMLEEVGASYDVKVLDYGTTMKAADYLAINPMGKVPAITHGDLVVTECAAICAYLADVFPQAGLAPAVSDPARGDYYRWLFFAAGPLEHAATNKAMGLSHPADKNPMMGFGCYEDVMNALDQKLQGSDYVAGGRFSAADVYLGSHIMWGTQFGTVEKRASFIAYLDRLKDRPAHLRASALDDALVPKPA